MNQNPGRRPGKKRPPKPSRYGKDNPRGAKPLPPMYNNQPRSPRPTAPETADDDEGAIFIEKWPTAPGAGAAQAKPAPKKHGSNQFRVLIAVHRPRYRGRTERACAVGGWLVNSLLNKQDVVGQVQKSEGAPDVVVLSSDFGRQKSLGIFRAIQHMRSTGMKIVGLIVNEEGLEGPDGIPAEELCDVMLMPPYTAAGLRQVLCGLYEEITGQSVPAEAASAGLEQDMEDEE
jgi:hypothetical protein